MQLNDRLEYESPKDLSIIPKERSAAFQHVAVLYVKYIQIFKKMELSYDQMVHPQKRRVLKENVLSVLGRILELRHKMVELESSDFHNFSDILFDMKLSPEDLKVSIPNFYIEERDGELENRQALLDSLNAKVFGQDQPPLFPEIKLSDAIRMIQLNERGRQGQLRAKYMRDIRLQAQREKDMDGGDDENEIQKAALKIQSSFRGFMARSKFQKNMHDELIFLGLEAPTKDSKSNPLLKSEANRQRRKVLQKQHEEEYQQALVNTKEKILKVEGPDMKEGIQDNFRQWYMEYKRLNGKLPEFPADRVWQQANFSFMNQDAQAGDQGDGDANVADDSKPQSESSKKKPGSADKKKGAAGKDEEVKEESFKFDSSDFIGKIKSSQNVYKNDWQSKDESENFAQKHDQDIIKATKRKEVEAEIKESVMEILKEELKNLKSAVERESGKKGKKGRKKSAKGKKKGKKGKDKKAKGAKGGKKGKKEKDLTSNRTMESLIEELVQTGLLQKVPKVQIDDFKGTFNLLAVSGAKTPIVEPTLGELQRVMSEYCILPLGYPKSEEGNGILPIPSVTKMFLCGPKGSGKTMLVNAIASEIGAHVFNLTPKNTAGQFVGKPNVTKMIHMAFKVAKANPPAVIYIDNFEMVFAKKVPKDDLSDPKRIKKDLLKNLKSLAPEDRVLFVGLSSKPWDGDAKVMLPIFEKFLLCPKPDYPSRYMIWSEFIGKTAPENVKEVNISLLSRLSAGMTTGQMKACAERVMTERRMKLVRTRPLESNEFASQIINCMPFNQEEDKLFQEWYEKTPLPKKRSSMLSGPVEEDGADKKKK